MNTNIEPNDGMKTMMADMAAEMAEWQRAAGVSIAEVAAGWLAPVSYTHLPPPSSPSCFACLIAICNREIASGYSARTYKKPWSAPTA